MFNVRPANNYLITEENDLDESDTSNRERTVQIKILDVLFNDRVCSLVYMHDSTSLLKLRSRDQMAQNLHNFEVQAFKLLVRNPNKFISRLKIYICKTFGEDLGDVTKFPISILSQSLVALKQSLNTGDQSINQST